uniref:2-(3-amino-3-carboxypropyl)histidine synthase subunit 2 n=1 Tax=Plectus sambesii TaxID=2011161 RepID=A0A914UUX5_9BILA
MSAEDGKSVSLFSNSEEVLSRKAEVTTDDETSSSLLLSPEEKLDFFEVVETADWIKKNSFDRVALQFPDDLMRDSVFVSKELEKRTNVKPFVLADTSYGSCCVDEIAAQHASASCLVHYGDACLSEPPEKLPVRFVFGKTAVDIEDYRSKLKSLVEQDAEKQRTKICLLYDSSLSHYSEEICRATRETFGEGVFDCALIAPADREEKKEEEKCSSSLGRRIPVDMESWEDATVVYVGTGRSPLLPLFLLSHPNCSRVIQYDTPHRTIASEAPTATRQLRRRLFLVEKVKDANTVGIVCGTLGVRGHRIAVDRVKQLCQLAHKKAYVFSVGKLNVPKLANFAAEIDIFV